MALGSGCLGVDARDGRQPVELRDRGVTEVRVVGPSLYHDAVRTLDDERFVAAQDAVAEVLDEFEQDRALPGSLRSADEHHTSVVCRSSGVQHDRAAILLIAEDEVAHEFDDVEPSLGGDCHLDAPGLRVEPEARACTRADHRLGAVRVAHTIRLDREERARALAHVDGLAGRVIGVGRLVALRCAKCGDVERRERFLGRRELFCTEVRAEECERPAEIGSVGELDSKPGGRVDEVEGPAHRIPSASFCCALSRAGRADPTIRDLFMVPSG
ncbi:hypothetical protein FLP10_09010 [Agromyces intestinalis]|uniref:Uncharacterized protein n=1 Tax=Agromyces intestinalis TaxID=2592652 RepID=A0A5C1YID5_9MICO|nr:hypothetical protein FLP10_09010 [Agromyces intestinalis]